MDYDYSRYKYGTQKQENFFLKNWKLLLAIILMAGISVFLLIRFADSSFWFTVLKIIGWIGAILILMIYVGQKNSIKEVFVAVVVVISAIFIAMFISKWQGERFEKSSHEVAFFFVMR